ncbi:transmembrane alpha-helix domain-containing protein [Colletotrichum tofieldiae]|uniref:Transmembrane alpha-helix domain-containing protein n=1 Tax=Colletotrichum tofieldiae TaxID=708197 RepID=A0A166PW51_9PEZI|nr:transmembrane alpha-helix domain-containing protein [Colletotrichum tofieldiae]GKT84256.1 transmembrane alpha-helix domain-containing protein [Colletotrichum tofieldiae]
MSAVKLDSNAWYAISEGRVANVSDPLTTSLQDTNNGLRVFGKTDALWQFQPVGDKDGRYLVRLNAAGVGQQLSVCWSSAEVHPSGTRGCLRKTESDESQQWDITEWESEKGTLKFTNVANGTGYVLDVHPGTNLFMSSEIEGTDGVSARQPAQHWIMTSSKAVNDGAYSTIYSAGTTPVGTATASGSGSASATASVTESGAGSVTPTAIDGSATASSTPGSSSSGGISTGAAAGIGVGVSLGAIAILGAAFFFWWRRRKTSRNAAGPPSDHHHELGHDGSTIGKLSPGTVNASTVGSPSPANGYYGQESKVLGHMQPHAHAAEANTNPIYEAPTETRYELDSGMSAPTHAPAQHELSDNNARR